MARKTSARSREVKEDHMSDVIQNTKSTDELIAELDTRLRKLKESGRFMPVPFRSGLGALTQTKLNMLELNVKSARVLDLLRDMTSEVNTNTGVIRAESQFLAELDGLSLNEAAARSRA
jgi:hypothetical protein